MNYAVNINDSTGLLGYILCEDYLYRRDTMYLFNAGYYAKLRWQKRVTNVWFYGTSYQYMVVDLRELKGRYELKLSREPEYQ